MCASFDADLDLSNNAAILTSSPTLFLVEVVKPNEGRSGQKGKGK